MKNCENLRAEIITFLNTRTGTIMRTGVILIQFREYLIKSGDNEIRNKMNRELLSISGSPTNAMYTLLKAIGYEQASNSCACNGGTFIIDKMII